jgi:hypothetical protein
VSECCSPPCRLGYASHHGILVFSKMQEIMMLFFYPSEKDSFLEVFHDERVND